MYDEMFNNLFLIVGGFALLGLLTVSLILLAIEWVKSKLKGK